MRIARIFQCLAVPRQPLKLLETLEIRVLKRLASAVQLRPWPPSFQSLSSVPNLSSVPFCSTNSNSGLPEFASKFRQILKFILESSRRGTRTLSTGVSPYNGLANSARPLPIRNQAHTVVSDAPDWTESGCSAELHAPQYAPPQTELTQQGEHRRSHLVSCLVADLRPHPSYARHRLSVDASRLSALAERGDLAFEDPIAITHERIVIDGYARWELAKRRGRPMLNCIEYEVRSEEALGELIRTHGPSRGFTDFVRIELLKCKCRSALTKRLHGCCQCSSALINYSLRRKSLQNSQMRSGFLKDGHKFTRTKDVNIFEHSISEPNILRNHLGSILFSSYLFLTPNRTTRCYRLVLSAMSLHPFFPIPEK